VPRIIARMDRWPAAQPSADARVRSVGATHTPAPAPGRGLAAGDGLDAADARDAADALDAVQMQAFAAGDAGVFGELYDRHERPLFRFLLRSLGEAAVAEELLQETWLAVVRNAHGPAPWTPRARFRTWLYGIARNKLIDHWRARDEEVRYEDLPVGGMHDESDAVGSGNAWLERIAAAADGQPEQQAQARAWARSYAQAVQALPAAQREAFLLHAQGGLTIEAVAHLTGVGAETVKSRVRYAFGRLRAALEDWR